MPVPVRPPITEIKIELYWKDQASSGSVSFANVKEFAEFLREHPDLAKAVGYEAKKKG